MGVPVVGGGGDDGRQRRLAGLQARHASALHAQTVVAQLHTALEQARQAAATERGREITRRFLGSGTPYTPHPVDFYNR